ncbi:hypothetical protein FJQ54_07250 [Sandaracinobacter neustonicus]|uniref:Uncharacterized protein n=1 Tax=Sandaracinobacter neustonicus TaxID=1715348 RepID=A0A501XNR7_9SPHN|nr:hypothetical protein [Sandaracinobacter neustonicus]TPE62311.1 hypothetical protein FJQ54_07250 [Sandaracinobacter neustonicus]
MTDKPTRQPRHDPRFVLHAAQPRANKLDARQRAICKVDPAFADALSARVNDPRRFAAFAVGATSYIRMAEPCPRCEGFRRRVRDRSCYACHLNRGRDNFERMRAGLSPHKLRSRDSQLDVLSRQRREKAGEFLERTFGSVTVKLFPSGRLEVHYPDGYVEPDLGKVDGRRVWELMDMLPELRDALIWARWF